MLDFSAKDVAEVEYNSDRYLPRPRSGYLGDGAQSEASPLPRKLRFCAVVKSSRSETSKKTKIKGDTSFIIEEMMDQGIAKGDITMSDGTGTDNMTCIIIQFRDESDVAAESTAAESGFEKEEYKK